MRDCHSFTRPKPYQHTSNSVQIKRIQQQNRALEDNLIQARTAARAQQQWMVVLTVGLVGLLGYKLILGTLASAFGF